MEPIIKKKYLKRYKKNQSNIKRLQYKIIDLDSRIQNVGSKVLSDMPRGGIPITKEDLIADKIETEERIARLKSRGRTIRREILDCIDTVDNALRAEVLELFFIDGLTQEQIAELKGYSVRYIQTLYADGIIDIDDSLIVQ